MNLSGKRLLICEEALEGYKGHYYSWIRAIRKVHLDAGAEVIVAGNINMDPSIQQEFGAHRVYGRNSWSGIYNHSKWWRRFFAILAHNRRLFCETAALLESVGSVDCILLPNVRIHHLIAWRFLLAANCPSRIGRLVPFFLISQAIYSQDFSSCRFPRNSLLLKMILRSYASEIKRGRIVLAGDSHVTCREYEMLSGIPFKTFPSPSAGFQTTVADSTGESVTPPRTAPTFLFLGVSNCDKGIDIIQEAILTLLDRDPAFPARFVLQWAEQAIDEDNSKLSIRDELRRAPQVELLERHLSDNEYRKCFSEADFLLLPYRRRAYFNRLSGVAVEAACAGLPIIVTENTWLSWAMDNFGFGVTVKDGDPGDLAKMIEYCVVNRSALRENAQRRRVVATEKNSTENYLSCVWH